MGIHPFIIYIDLGGVPKIFLSQGTRKFRGKWGIGSMASIHTPHNTPNMSRDSHYNGI